MWLINSFYIINSILIYRIKIAPYKKNIECELINNSNIYKCYLILIF